MTNKALYELAQRTMDRLPYLIRTDAEFLARDLAAAVLTAHKPPAPRRVSGWAVSFDGSVAGFFPTREEAERRCKDWSAVAPHRDYFLAYVAGEEGKGPE